jgi:hypothetical protein
VRWAFFIGPVGERQAIFARTHLFFLSPIPSAFIGQGGCMGIFID